MENQKKIVYTLFIILTLMGCMSEGKQTKKKTNKVAPKTLSSLDKYVGKILVEQDDLYFQVRSIYCESGEVENYFTCRDNLVSFVSLIDLSGDTVKLNKYIDQNSFRVIGTDPKEKNSIRNPYYFDGRMNCYYVDKNYVYAFIDKTSPQFKLLGNARSLSLLGGNYIRVANRIYSKGIQITGVDPAKFHTMEVFNEGSEWLRTIGLDDQSLYLNDQVLDKASFDKLIAPNDSLEKLYFSN